MSRLRIALTKGRLEKFAIETFENIGIDCTELKDKGRKLIFHSHNSNVDFVLVKATDVLTYVEHGAVDIGIVGKDTLMEYNKDFYEVADLQVGKCKFAVAALPETDLYQGYNRKKIATKYPYVASSYFRKKGIDVEIIKIEGSVELAPILNLADAIVDIVETGTTLKENGLVIKEEICDISARVIVNIASMKMKQEEIGRIIKALSETEDGNYVKYN